MKPELQKKLYGKYPLIFVQKDLPMRQTCMCWGIDCGDGWYQIIDQLCGSIQNYCDSHNTGIVIHNKEKAEGDREELMQVEAIQVKEKFGGLRFYIHGGDDTIYGMIWLAEHMSYGTCETCGTTEDVKQRGEGWIFTLCPKCDAKRRKARYPSKKGWTSLNLKDVLGGAFCAVKRWLGDYSYFSRR